MTPSETRTQMRAASGMQQGFSNGIKDVPNYKGPPGTEEWNQVVKQAFGIKPRYLQVWISILYSDLHYIKIQACTLAQATALQAGITCCRFVECMMSSAARKIVHRST